MRSQYRQIRALLERELGKPRSFLEEPSRLRDFASSEQRSCEQQRGIEPIQESEVLAALGEECLELAFRLLESLLAVQREQEEGSASLQEKVRALRRPPHVQLLVSEVQSHEPERFAVVARRGFESDGST